MPTWACFTPLKTSRSMGKALITLCETSMHNQNSHWLRPANGPPCCLVTCILADKSACSLAEIAYGLILCRYVSNTRVKFILIIDEVVPKDEEMRLVGLPKTMKRHCKMTISETQTRLLELRCKVTQSCAADIQEVSCSIRGRCFQSLLYCQHGALGCPIWRGVASAYSACLPHNKEHSV